MHSYWLWQSFALGLQTSPSPWFVQAPTRPEPASERDAKTTTEKRRERMRFVRRRELCEKTWRKARATSGRQACRPLLASTAAPKRRRYCAALANEKSSDR